MNNLTNPSDSEKSATAFLGGVAANRFGTDSRDRNEILFEKLTYPRVDRCARNTGGFMDLRSCGTFYPEQGNVDKRLVFCQSRIFEGFYEPDMRIVRRSHLNILYIPQY